jgi:hypothetical protein
MVSKLLLHANRLIVDGRLHFTLKLERKLMTWQRELLRGNRRKKWLIPDPHQDCDGLCGARPSIMIAMTKRQRRPARHSSHSSVAWAADSEKLLLIDGIKSASNGSSSLGP